MPGGGRRSDGARRFDATTIAAELERELRAAGTPERAAHEKRYLKSELQHLGVAVPVLRKVARGLKRAHAAPAREEVIALVEVLWSRPVHELRAMAVMVLDTYVALLAPGDMRLLERLLRESKTWALVDYLAVSVVGELVERHPALAGKLDRWARDRDFWIRRSAVLALLRPLRRGGGDFDRFARYADAMLEEKEFFIRKAIGWVLREVSAKRPELVWRWIAPRAARASGVTLREAARHLPAEQKKKLLAGRSRPTR